jgi:hypothetical protein
MSPEFGESHPYLRTFDGGVFSVVTRPVKMASTSTSTCPTPRPRRQTCARWKDIKEAQRETLTLERERVQATKLEAEATLTKTKNDAKSFELTKIVEEAKILSMPLTGMDALTKSWYIMIRDRIGKKLMSIQEPPVKEVVPPSI